MNSNLIMIVVVFGAFWLLVIRPQQQRQKKHAQMVAALSPGTEIVTIGGIYATIVAVGERLRVQVADGSEFEISPQAVGRVLAETDEEPAAGQSDDEEGTDADAGSLGGDAGTESGA